MLIGVQYMIVVDWIKTQRKKLLVHGLILSSFVFYSFFLADPFFDRFQRIPGESQLHKYELPAMTDNIMYHMEFLDPSATALEVTGWAFIEEQNSKNCQTYLVFKSDSDTYVFDTHRHFMRPDVTEYFKETGLNLDDSGFLGTIPLGKLEVGDYIIGLYIKKSDIVALKYTDKVLRKAKGAAEIVSLVSEPQENVLHVSNQEDIALPVESNDIRLNIEFLQDVLKDEKVLMEIRGWAFIENQCVENSSIYLILQSDFATHVFDTMLQKRPDVTDFFAGLDLHLDNSGFIARIPREKLESGTYKLGVYIKKDDTEALQYTALQIDVD